MSISEQPQIAAGIRVRPFADSDYAALVIVENASFPDEPSTVAEWRFYDEHWDAAKYLRLRYVADDPSSGNVFGYAEFRHVPWRFHPRKFAVHLLVHSSARRRGVGSRLWAHVLAEARARNALSAGTTIHEDIPEGVQFALRRGFHEVMRMWESRLDVRSTELAPFQDRVRRVLASGVSITTLAAERAKDPANLQRIYALSSAIGEDIPSPDRFTPPEFPLFLSYAVESPSALPEAYFIAVVDGQYVGMSNLFKPELGDWLNQGTTGVLRAYRGRGIATVLKVRTIEYAKAQGAREIRTMNETKNAGILAINERFRICSAAGQGILRKGPGCGRGTDAIFRMIRGTIPKEWRWPTCS